MLNRGKCIRVVLFFFITVTTNGFDLDTTEHLLHSIEFPSPAFADIDGDNIKELLVGGQVNSQGKVELYKNLGDNSNPVFKNPVYLQADGTDIVVASSN